MNRLTKTAPETIYLCISDEEIDTEFPFPRDCEVTWSEDKEMITTVKYIRADLADKLRGAGDDL